MEASRQQFACANPERSEKTQRRMRDIMMEEDSKLDFERHKFNPLPQSVLVSSTNTQQKSVKEKPIIQLSLYICKLMID